MAEEKKNTSNDNWDTRLIEIILIILLLVGIFNWASPQLKKVYDAIFIGSVDTSKNLSIPPNSNKEEERMLGALISGRIDANEAFSKLTNNMFQNPKNKAVFMAVKSLYNDNIPINVNTISARLSERNDLSNIGGRPHLEYLILSVGSEKNYEVNLFGKIVRIIKNILLLISFLSIIGIAIISVKFIFLRKEQIATYLNLIPEHSTNSTNIFWGNIVELSQSDNPSDRKIAIIKADSLLDHMVSGMGYSGDTLGEKLKGIEKSNFLTLENAWEVHKYRNTIAHEGKEITKRDAQYIMSLYEKVFKEFEYLQ